MNLPACNYNSEFRSPTKSASSKNDLDSGFDERQNLSDNFSQIQIQIKETSFPGGNLNNFREAILISILRRCQSHVAGQRRDFRTQNDRRARRPRRRVRREFACQSNVHQKCRTCKSAYFSWIIEKMHHAKTRFQEPIEHEQSLGEYLSGNASTVELEGHFFTVAVNTTKQSLATALVVANADAMLLSSTRTRSKLNLWTIFYLKLTK